MFPIVHQVSAPVTRVMTCGVGLSGCLGRFGRRESGIRGVSAGGLGRAEREPELLQQRAALVVGLRRGDHGDVHAADTVDLVLVDLVEYGLLRETEGVVAGA